VEPRDMRADAITGRVGHEGDPADEASDRKDPHHRQQRPKRAGPVLGSRLLPSGCSLLSLRHLHPTSPPSPGKPAVRESPSEGRSSPASEGLPALTTGGSSTCF